MKNSLSVRRFGAATALTALTLVGGGVAMASTASASTVAATSVSASASAEAVVTPDGDATGCYSVLYNFDELTTSTKLVCVTTAVAAVVNASAAYGHCVFTMSGLGVNSRVAVAACTFAAFN
ncbi:hypothetical protein KGQ19_29140 [Catenulispora sp. NL8]|uniref:Uncharacterized protein n=1 Tax=Catenulispora pinistramenti TaxID=2705254 RepID=A0ABS5KY66_9ACTN|nr:hypothetical protein [Catenulispora pinistramenti]MBS2550945.1 hypothetical protein [Catenulispora pinistramenti]